LLRWSIQSHLSARRRHRDGVRGRIVSSAQFFVEQETSLDDLRAGRRACKTKVSDAKRRVSRVVVLDDDLQYFICMAGARKFCKVGVRCAVCCKMMMVRKEPARFCTIQLECYGKGTCKGFGKVNLEKATRHLRRSYATTPTTLTLQQ
jgi:hypothetical protein